MIDDRNIVVVIPAYNPDEKLISLLKTIKLETTYQVIVVNDGSDSFTKPIFNQALDYGIVLGYQNNQGKGTALKTAFKYLKDNYLEELIIVTADADGQHQVQDIKAVANMAKLFPNKLILGTRIFKGKIPLKSKLGNLLTSQIFYLTNHVKIKDTQTGLRAFRSGYLELMLNISGSRYEYEMNMLIAWAKSRQQFYQQAIATIYLKNNASSHFKPLQDSFKIYLQILKFSASSLISFIVDYASYLFMLLMTVNFSIGISVLISNIFARLISATLNYNLNRHLVFNDKQKISKTLGGYVKLAVSILILNTILVELLVNFGLSSYLAKIIVEVMLFILSLIVQKKYIFNEKAKGKIQHEIL